MLNLFLLLTFLFTGCTSVESLQVTVSLPAFTVTYFPTLTHQASPTIEPSDTVAPEETLTPRMPSILSHPHTEVA